ncbi:hypothetical protein [Enterococcus entomosocium]|uniref:hypothetical protein n=1 Tax=Enterococcus entomosocium TaxID=3034352 RepID=UPI0026485DC8|nr:hypothetical protein [Enterococcus entomosocium]
MTDIRQIERMTPYEFEIRMTAHQLKRLDEQEAIHLQAWANRKVKAEKNIGTEKKPKIVPVFTKFEDFFDKEKLEKEILGIQTQEVIQPPKQTKLLKLMKKANS